MRPYRVEYVQLKDWQADITGLWLAENESWLLLRYIPVDYVVDGYVLVAKSHIASRQARKGRQQLEQVLKLKQVPATIPQSFKFADTLELLRWTEQQYGLIHFHDEEQSAFLGWVNEADVVHLWIDSLEPNGTMAAREPVERPFALDEICLILFEDDYSQSLKLLWQSKNRQDLLRASDN